MGPFLKIIYINEIEFMELSLVSGPALRAICALSNFILMTFLREVPLYLPLEEEMHSAV